MARFTLEYDVTLNKKTKIFILENITPSMTSADSFQYCLEELIELLKSSDNSDMFNLPEDDLETLNVLNNEGVDYVEICL